ncbi:Cof-type HAD-IIB family hydrolase [Lactococcus nasutitermitis]|uniref:Cof-type HAD-IIB family hydrolase n=1 Tax=Lactococcus nasutitermitis TaxID=1652957 RepID=A0ABV9JH75_9LACT|nr:Cof-type HAD-IIB family hydrolase [Lactococcus nasutitermitis]
MNSEIKLIALDLDGTVLNSEKEIPQENIDAIQAARAKGIHVVITTGRPLVAIEHFLKTLDMTGFDDFSITFNGGLVQRNTGEIMSKKPFSMAEAQDLKEMTMALGMPCDILSEQYVYMTKSARESLYPQLNKLLTFRKKELVDLPEDLVINKIVSCTDGDFLDTQIPKIPAEYFEKYSIFKSQARLVEFMPKGINKAFGLSQLIKLLDLKPENVMAMGDEENDLSMISWAGYGVAMGNAVPAVKEAARIVSELTNEEFAVADVIKRYVL